MTFEEALQHWRALIGTQLRFGPKRTFIKADSLMRNFEARFRLAVAASGYDMAYVIAQTEYLKQTSFMVEPLQEIRQRLIDLAEEGKVEQVDPLPQVPRSEKGGKYGSAEHHH